MVNLRTVRRVLAVDLGLDGQAIERCLGRVGLEDRVVSDLTEISIEEALRIVTLAEGLVAPLPA